MKILGKELNMYFQYIIACDAECPYVRNISEMSVSKD
jgi:hypothetical protein